jgi:hypothetical protein
MPNDIKKLVLTAAVCCCGAFAADVTVAAPSGSARIDFGLSRLEQTLQQRGDRMVRTPANQVDAADVVVNIATGNLGLEDFRTVRVARGEKQQVLFTGGAENRAMYGLLDVAEQIRLNGSLGKVPQRTVRPRFGFRAIKFNLPWMSYRRGDALQLHMETCRDLNFWRSYLDMMADNRFNTLTLWNLHPFTFMIRPRNFPEASGFSDAELADWQKFYHSLFKMAKDRGDSRA